MSVNKYKPHVWVIPEDLADEELVNGFLQADGLDQRAIGVGQRAGGWERVLAIFADEYVSHLRTYKGGHVVLLLDFDGREGRRESCESRIPDDLKPRVFVIGAWDNPEVLRAELRLTPEAIGRRAAKNCMNADGFWDGPQLSHNAAEVERMAAALKPFLFGT